MCRVRVDRAPLCALPQGALPPTAVTEYEMQRQRNIDRNNRALEALVKKR